LAFGEIFAIVLGEPIHRRVGCYPYNHCM
jgi:hypothetical protein